MVEVQIPQPAVPFDHLPRKTDNTEAAGAPVPCRATMASPVRDAHIAALPLEAIAAGTVALEHAPAIPATVLPEVHHQERVAIQQVLQEAVLAVTGVHRAVAEVVHTEAPEEVPEVRAIVVLLVLAEVEAQVTAGLPVVAVVVRAALAEAQVAVGLPVDVVQVVEAAADANNHTTIILEI